ncbi:hypothetical protein [Metabacillus halosaccharovorans]|uniref:hypothetical protein n=1 Tax=Metabacillus halosaccharovorans TaxID=930124 RepID=UPI003736234D
MNRYMQPVIDQLKKENGGHPIRKIADCVVNEQGIISVCAYDANNTPAAWKSLLMNCHGVMLSDTEIIYST